jgi:hypothetical protein
MEHPAAPFSDSAPRFWSRVDMSGGADACWPYTRGLQFSLSRRQPRPIGACAWILTYGSKPVDMLVVRRCADGLNTTTSKCVNPHHLELITYAENAKRMWALRRAPNRGMRKGAKHQKPRMVCPKGHPYRLTAVVRQDGYRRCKVCHRASVIRARKKARGEQLSPLVARLLADVREAS